MRMKFERKRTKLIKFSFKDNKIKSSLMRKDFWIKLKFYTMNRRLKIWSKQNQSTFTLRMLILNFLKIRFKSNLKLLKLEIKKSQNFSKKFSIKNKFMKKTLLFLSKKTCLKKEKLTICIKWLRCLGQSKRLGYRRLM